MRVEANVVETMGTKPNYGDQKDKQKAKIDQKVKLSLYRPR